MHKFLKFLEWNSTCSGGSSVHHQKFSLYTQQWYMSHRFADSLRAGSVLILLASCQQNLYDIYHCCVYSEKLLMMDRGTVRNMYSFPSWSCSQAVSKPVWHIPLLCVQCWTPDDGQRNCPKYAEFYSKNKFEKLVHLVGFIIRTLSGCSSVLPTVHLSTCYHLGSHRTDLTLIVLMWRIGWAHNNARK